MPEPTPSAAAASGTDDTYRMRRLMKAYDDGIDAATFYELAHEVGVRYVADAARSDLQAQLDQANAENARLRDLLRDILTAFCEPGYPGYPAMRSGWINVEQIKQWQEETTRG